MNDNQNAFVTRSTSRVLAAPGGKSSTGFLFGGSTAANTNNKSKAKVDAKPAEKTSGKEETAMSAAARIKEKNESQHFSLYGQSSSSNSANPNVIEEKGTSSNAFASSSTTNSYNVLTDRPTSRVLRPPGGHSSIKLG